MNRSVDLLLDTNVILRLSEGMPVSAACREAVRSPAGRLLVSSVSAWEIGTLATRTGNTRQLFRGDTRGWLQRFLENFRAEALDLSWESALAAASLPEPFHRDPADRLLVAQARVEDLLLLTSDRNILAYADAGHVRALAC
ncbi:type II toxin-antitoxin system VapC family toxin [Sandarakinorhabdus sp.]|uniref:type II toxin-antitoxin system VapC family toxin n=1 Tax=Sandarakinorhabdus sp. TaxID=1916663 RepID=UPI003F72E4A5